MNYDQEHFEALRFDPSKPPLPETKTESELTEAERWRIFNEWCEHDFDND